MKRKWPCSIGQNVLDLDRSWYRCYNGTLQSDPATQYIEPICFCQKYIKNICWLHLVRIISLCHFGNTDWYNGHLVVKKHAVLRCPPYWINLDCRFLQYGQNRMTVLLLATSIPILPDSVLTWDLQHSWAERVVFRYYLTVYLHGISSIAELSRSYSDIIWQCTYNIGIRPAQLSYAGDPM